MQEKLLELVNENALKELRTILIEMNEVDIAQLFENIDRENIVKIFRLMPKEQAAEVFAYLPAETQQLIVETITDKEIAIILDELFLDDTVDFIEEMPANVVKRVLKTADAETRKYINTFLQYAEDSAGSVMTIEFVDLKKQMTVTEAFEHIRKTGVDKETIYTCYVTDKNRHLEGIVSVRKLLLSKDDELIGDIMKENVIFATTSDDQETIANMFSKYGLISIPIVDSEKRLVGIVTIDDALDIIEQEATEDFEKMAAITPSERPYLKTGVFELAKHRIMWLLILMISATFTGSIMKVYEDVLSSMIVLSVFIPMLMDTGGNAGSQSATLIIRGLALGEIQTKDWIKVASKELLVAIIAGIVLAVVNYFRIVLFNMGSSQVAFVVSLSMICTIIMAKVVGSMLPIAAHKMKIDPAIMASPLITTIVDAMALFTYFTFARVFLGI